MAKIVLIKFDTDETSAKVLYGIPINEDNHFQIWPGLIPIKSKRLTPIVDGLSKNIPLPEHLKYLK